LLWHAAIISGDVPGLFEVDALALAAAGGAHQVAPSRVAASRSSSLKTDIEDRTKLGALFAQRASGEG
jgi:hypothetical protein